MNQSNARAGWDWIIGGWNLFRARPFFLTNLFFIYVFGMILLGVVPVLGQILPVLLSPVFTFLFMHACFKTEAREQITFRDLLAVLNRQILFRLVMAGSCYLLFAFLAVALSFLIDGGNIFVLFSEQAKEQSSTEMFPLFITVSLILLAYIPFLMAMWFAIPLIGWKDMSLGKAMFYSFFAFSRNFRPFLVYFGIWIALVFGFPYLIAALFGIIAGQGIAVFVVFVFSFILSVLIYCSFYPTYRDIFGRPDANM